MFRKLNLAQLLSAVIVDIILINKVVFGENNQINTYVK